MHSSPWFIPQHHQNSFSSLFFVYSLSFDLYAMTGRSTSRGMNFMKIATLPLSVVHPFTFFCSSYLPTHMHTYSFPHLLDAVSFSLSLPYSVMSLHSLRVLLSLLSFLTPYSCYPGAISLILVGSSVPYFLHRYSL